MPMMSIKQRVTFSFAETEVSSFSQRSNFKKRFRPIVPPHWQTQKTNFQCSFHGSYHWRCQDFVTGGEVRYGSIGGLEYEVPQSRLYCLCINVDLCSTALQCICRVIRISSMTMKAHTHTHTHTHV